MTIHVECYAGYRGNQEPLAFWFGARRLIVRDIVDRWFAPTQRWFKVEADDGQLYVLRQDEATAEWDWPHLLGGHDDVDATRLVRRTEDRALCASSAAVSCPHCRRPARRMCCRRTGGSARSISSRSAVAT